MTEPMPSAATAARYSWCYDGCDHRSCEQYNRTGVGKCWEMWHAEIRNGPYCAEPEDHEGWHKGFGMVWPLPSGASVEVARRFLSAYRRIPNAWHEIVLRDDGWIESTLRGFESAVRFVGLGPSDD